MHMNIQYKSDSPCSQCPQHQYLLPERLTAFVTCYSFVGEMGGTVLAHPGQYLKIYNMIKQGWKNPAKLKVGSRTVV